MKIINLDELKWEYNHDCDCDLPSMDDLPKEDLEDVKFISRSDLRFPFVLFARLPLKKVIFDFDISIDYARDKSAVTLEKLESSGIITIYDSMVQADIIKCEILESFASTLEFKELACKEIEVKLTTIVNSENTSVESKGFVHTDHGVVLSRKKFNLQLGEKTSGLTLID